MNQKKIAQLSIELMLRYYDNDVSLFLNSMDEDVLWYGPAEGQFLQGKKAMAKAWAAERNPLTFTVQDIQVRATAANPSSCIVVLQYSVVTHYPSGNNLALNQRLALAWCERISTDAHGKRIRQPRILLCDVTNPHPKSEEDVIYPVHFEQIHAGISISTDKGQRLHFTGPRNTEYYLFSGSVLWGDSCARGRHSELHLADGSVVEVCHSVRDIVAAWPELFLRCHSSHFVNPTYVQSIRRFTITMPGGAELPVPEKSYTAFKRALQAFGNKVPVPTQQEPN